MIFTIIADTPRFNPYMPFLICKEFNIKLKQLANNPSYMRLIFVNSSIPQFYLAKIIQLNPKPNIEEIDLNCSEKINLFTFSKFIDPYFFVIKEKKLVIINLDTQITVAGPISNPRAFCVCEENVYIYEAKTKSIIRYQYCGLNNNTELKGSNFLQLKGLTSKDKVKLAVCDQFFIIFLPKRVQLVDRNSGEFIKEFSINSSSIFFEQGRLFWLEDIFNEYSLSSIDIFSENAMPQQLFNRVFADHTLPRVYGHYLTWHSSHSLEDRREHSFYTLNLNMPGSQSNYKFHTSGLATPNLMYIDNGILAILCFSAQNPQEQKTAFLEIIDLKEENKLLFQMKIQDPHISSLTLSQNKLLLTTNHQKIIRLTFLNPI